MKNVYQSRIGPHERQRTIWRKCWWLCTLQPMPPARARGFAFLLTTLLACRPAAPQGVGPVAEESSRRATNPLADTGWRRAEDGTGLPPVPKVEGPIQLHVVYPRANEPVSAGDSTFIFGSAGTGDATLTVNGHAVPLAPNGAWLAWVPISNDSVITFEITARNAADSATLVHVVRRAPRFVAPAAPVWIDTLSFAPARRAWWPADEPLPISVRAAEGATVRLVLPDGRAIPLTADRVPVEVPAGIRAFDRDTGNLITPTRADRYSGTIRGIALGAPLGPLVGTLPPDGGPVPMVPPDSMKCCADPGQGAAPAMPVVEAIIGADTARAFWPLRLSLLDSVPALVAFDDDTAGLGQSDSLTVGRARPGATYHWFFPTGTRTVATGRLGDDLRVRLSREQEAWVPAADARPLPSGLPALRTTIGSLTLTPSADRLTLRIPAGARVPFRVEEERNRLTLRLYSAVGDIDWIRLGPGDPYLRDVRWLQATSDEVTITVDLEAPVWGYRTRWVRNDLLFEIRRPPVVDSLHPLAGRLILIDPGHPPLGATGPTGLREAEANLAVAFQLRDLLVAEGARVILSRTTDQALDLWPRVRMADTTGAEILVSIHNNALPDGVNPFTNNGASVFYNQPRSLPLAQAVQRALVRRLGVRDLGVGRGDLALVRPTWMPSILTEGLFMMVPEQEAALREQLGQRRYALAVRDGLVAWLRGVARSAPVVP
jgi:N-acetylmuramoyl-L-alanine amidase